MNAIDADEHWLFISDEFDEDGQVDIEIGEHKAWLDKEGLVELRGYIDELLNEADEE